MSGEESLKGMLLFSTPALFDPNFRRTVVLLGEHSDEGAMGLVLNRPSETTVGDAVPDLAAVAGFDAPVYVGGPVQPEAVLVLAEFDDASAAAGLVVGDVGFARADGDLDQLGAATCRARVFAGYSGWAPGQLESVVTSLMGAAIGISLGVVLAVLLIVRVDFLVLAWPIGSLLLFAVAAIIIGLIAAILPARRASRLNVLEALQYE